MPKGYDQKCLDLAEYFLRDANPTPADKEELAQVIQDAIENWFSARERQS